MLTASESRNLTSKSAQFTPNDTTTFTPPTCTNEELIAEYISWKASDWKRAAVTYRIWVERFQQFVNRPPEEWTYRDFTEFRDMLQGAYSPNCIYYGLQVIRNYIRFFAEQGRVRFSLYFTRVKAVRANSHQAITERHYRDLLSYLRKRVEQSDRKRKMKIRNLAIIMMLHDTGLRVNELTSIKIDQLEEDRSAVVETEKNTESRRVFWNLDTEEVLNEYLVDHLKDRNDELGNLFSISDRCIQKMLSRALKGAHIEERYSPHSFRHAFIHRMAKLGVPDAIIAQLVGHKSPNTIAHYTKLSRPEYRDYALKQFARSSTA